MTRGWTVATGVALAFWIAAGLDASRPGSLPTTLVTRTMRLSGASRAEVHRSLGPPLQSDDEREPTKEVWRVGRSRVTVYYAAGVASGAYYEPDVRSTRGEFWAMGGPLDNPSN